MFSVLQKKLRCFTKLSTEYALNEYKRPHYLVVKLDPHSSIFFDERDKKCVIFLKYCLRKVGVHFAVEKPGPQLETGEHAS